MLLSHVADGHLVSLAIHDGDAKQLLGQENSLGVMTKGAVAEVREECFRLIKPVVNWKIVLRCPAELSCAALCMLESVGHNLHLVRGRRVIFKSIVALKRQLARAHVEDDISETAAIALISERYYIFEM